MLRSLLSVTRVIPLLLITLIATIIIYPYMTPRQPLFPGHSANCHDNGYCDVTPDKDLNQPPSRQEFASLEHKIKLLTQELEKMKHKEPPKVLTPDEKIWEARRTECGDGVIRNIDYHHVQPA